MYITYLHPDALKTREALNSRYFHKATENKRNSKAAMLLFEIAQAYEGFQNPQNPNLAGIRSSFEISRSSPLPRLRRCLDFMAVFGFSGFWASGFRGLGVKA